MLQHAHPEVQGAEYVVFADASRRYTDCSDAVCDLLGYTREEILSRTIDDLSYKLDEVPQLFAKYLKDGSLEGEFVLRRKDQAPVPIRFKAVVFKDGCHAAIWTPMKDWREPYLAALLEMDATKLGRKLEIAMVAIEGARAAHAQGAERQHESQAMNDAVSALQSLARTIKARGSSNR
jgi:PAS domain-containing protein